MIAAALLLLAGPEDVDRVLRHPQVQAWAERVRRTSGVKAVAMVEERGEIGLFEDHPDHLVRWATIRIDPRGRLEAWDVESDDWRPFP